MSTSELLRGLVLNAKEIKNLTDWPDPMIEDYLSILENLVIIANAADAGFDKKIEEIATTFNNGSIPFADTGFLIENYTKFFWDAVNKRLGIGTNAPTESLDVKGTTRFGDQTTNYSGFSSTGVLTQKGTARTKHHLTIKAENTKLGPTSPTVANIGNFSVLQFTGVGAAQSILTTFHTPEDWAVGTDFSVHVHWAPVNANAGNVFWEMSWKAVASNSNEVLSGAGTGTGVVDATELLQDELLESDDMTISGASISAEDIIGITLSRDPSDPLDTYASAASFVFLEIEYTSDKLGEST